MTARHPNHRDPATLPSELRRPGVPAAVRAWIEHQARSRVVGVRRLAGASSAAVHALRFADGSTLVLRRYVWPEFLEAEPDAPRREVDALEFARAHGLAVPEVVAHDVTGEGVPDGVPALLMGFLPGTARAVPDLDRLAEVAASIHAVDAAGFGHDYFPWFRDTMTAPPALATRPALWEQALAVWHDEEPEYTTTFIHHDFHPGNVLWTRSRLSGVVDWANACRGPADRDVSHCRWNLLLLADAATADAFLRAYEACTGRAYHPYWEVASVLEHDPDQFTAEQVAIDEPRLERALAALGHA